MILFLNDVIIAQSLKSDGAMGSSLMHGPRGRFRKNRGRFLRRLGLDPKRTVMAGLVHGTRVKILKRIPLSRRVPNTDALITQKADIGLAITTSDCMPVFIWWPDGVAIAHAGRVGLLAGVVEKTLRQIFKLGAKRRDIRVWVGPAVRPCCYEINLQATLRRQLAKAPFLLKRRQIKISTKCTSCGGDKEFFSYRWRKRKRRMAGGQNMLLVITRQAGKQRRTTAR